MEKSSKREEWLSAFLTLSTLTNGTKLPDQE